MPRQYFFWKYFNTIIVLYCIIVQKNPIFVQLSPIQCTYSNIFIRFFKFFPANTNIYQNSYRVIGALCGLRQGVLSSQCGHLISFGTKYPAIASFYLLKISNKRELIKISIQFVCKLQSIFFLYTKVNRSIFSHHIHLYLYLLKHTYYIW